METDKMKVNPSLTWKKKVIFSFLTFLVSVVVLEMTARVYFAFKVGPRVLLYGTSFHRKEIKLSVNAAAKKPEIKTYKKIMSKQELRKRRTIQDHDNKGDGYSKYYPYQKESILI